MLQRSILTVIALVAGLSGVAAAQDDVATVQMRDGTKFAGRIEEMTTSELFVRVTLHDQRRVPVGSVALIDRVGGASGLPDTEVREATGSEHLLMLSNGSSLKGQLLAIRGGEGSANGNEPRAYIFRADGREQSFPQQQVARIYLGRYPFAANVTAPATNEVKEETPALASGNDVPGAIRVPAASTWVNTGMVVRRGEAVAFSTTGQVQLSTNPNDRAYSAGTTRTAPAAPLPNANAGALIGRIGNGAPFGIGDQSSVPMPADGQLFLAVNDDVRVDNSGEFVVSMRRTRR